MWIVDYYRRYEERKAVSHESTMILLRAFSERGAGEYLIKEIIPEYSESDEELLYTVRLYRAYECRRFHSEYAAMIAYMLSRKEYYSVQIREEEPEDDEEIDSIRCAACRDR